MPHVRPATDADYEGFARLFPELRVDDPTPSVEKWKAELAPTCFVAEEAGAVIGYAHFQRYATEGIVRQLVVAPSHRGRRVGEALLREVARVFREAGVTKWGLNVKPDNAPALALYRRLGMREAYESQSLRFGWELLARLSPPPAGATVVEVTAGLDATVEDAHGLPRGTFATARALPGRVLLALEAGERVLACAVFVPAFPGAYPFRAADAAAAHGLLLGLKPFALSEPPYMQTVIEGQPSLARALVDAGAQVRLDIVHLEGPLPP